MGVVQLFDYDAPKSTREMFEEFHKQNPHVYRKLHRMALDLVERGNTKIGIGMLFEVLRWNHMSTYANSDFKLNNNYRAFYARLLMEDPRLEGVFEIRQQTVE